MLMLQFSIACFDMTKLKPQHLQIQPLDDMDCSIQFHPNKTYNCHFNCHGKWHCLIRKYIS